LSSPISPAALRPSLPKPSLALASLATSNTPGGTYQSPAYRIAYANQCPPACAVGGTPSGSGGYGSGYVLGDLEYVNFGNGCTNGIVKVMGVDAAGGVTSWANGGMVGGPCPTAVNSSSTGFTTSPLTGAGSGATMIYTAAQAKMQNSNMGYQIAEGELWSVGNRATYWNTQAFKFTHNATQHDFMSSTLFLPLSSPLIIYDAYDMSCADGLTNPIVPPLGMVGPTATSPSPWWPYTDNAAITSDNFYWDNTSITPPNYNFKTNAPGSGC
jgi:hypothetical protein